MAIAGPGEYLPDVTEGITRVEDLPKAKVARRSRNYRSPCGIYFNADMDEVYRLFDRRCRSDTALEKLAKLRCRARRFKQVGRALNKLFSPNLDKALTFLDDSLLPATSKAVERGFRRHRKMQKTVYRVRTRAWAAHAWQTKRPGGVDRALGEPTQGDGSVRIDSIALQGS